MNIAVCIKQVPDTEAQLCLNADSSWIDEEEIPFIINESDLYALEEALQIAEEFGGEVTVFSLGPERVKEALRKTLALGAVRGRHLLDERFAGGDAWSTGKALAAAIQRESFDLVLTGSQSDDLGFGSTGSMIAGILGWPHAWLVMGVKVEVGKGAAEVVREMESGKNEILRIQLPALLQIQAGINHPRYASLRGIMQAKRKELLDMSLEDLELDPEDVGSMGARIETRSVFTPDRGKAAEILEGDPATVAASLVDKLRKEAKVI